MGLFSRTKKQSQQADPRANGAILQQWKKAPPRRDTTALLNAYREIPRLGTVVDAVADAVAEVRWNVEGQSADHPLLTLLDSPNDYMSGPDLIKLICIYLDLVGEAYLLVTSVADFPVSIWPIPPDRIRELPDDSLPVSQRVYTIAMGPGRITEIPASQIIPIKRFDPANPLGRGIGPAQALGDEIDTDEFGSRFLKSYLYNDATPAAVIGIEDLEKTSPEQIKAFGEALRAEHQGPERAGKVMLTSGKTTVSRLDTPLKDMAIVDLRRFLSDFIRITYRVPPEVIGDLQSSNKATAFAAREHFARYCVVPRVRIIMACLQRGLANRFPGKPKLTHQKLIPSDMDRRLQTMIAQPMAFSYDEWRAVADLPPDPNRQGYPMPMPGQKPEGE